MQPFWETRQPSGRGLYARLARSRGHAHTFEATWGNSLSRGGEEKRVACGSASTVSPFSELAMMRRLEVADAR
jgi:hypothetical protein